MDTFMRIRFITNHKHYKRGDTINVSPNEAFGLIDIGVVKVTKDVTLVDYKISEVKYGKSTLIRPNKRK